MLKLCGLCQAAVHYAATPEIARLLFAREQLNADDRGGAAGGDKMKMSIQALTTLRNPRDRMGGCTPLHVAARNGRLDMVQFLVQEGNALVGAGKAPLASVLGLQYGRCHALTV